MGQMNARQEAWLKFAEEPRKFKTAVEHWEAGYAAGQTANYQAIDRGELISIIWAKIESRPLYTMQGVVADVLDALDFEMMYREMEKK